MVRLKETWTTRKTAKTPFQFQYGAIEGEFAGMMVADANKFQFQYGAIEGLSEI